MLRLRQHQKSGELVDGVKWLLEGEVGGVKGKRGASAVGGDAGSTRGAIGPII